MAKKINAILAMQVLAQNTVEVSNKAKGDHNEDTLDKELKETMEVVKLAEAMAVKGVKPLTVALVDLMEAAKVETKDMVVIRLADMAVVKDTKYAFLKNSYFLVFYIFYHDTTGT